MPVSVMYTGTLNLANFLMACNLGKTELQLAPSLTSIRQVIMLKR